jgi:hypothetical protein
MKALFLFFLLLNAAYFYYQNEVQDDAAAPTILKQPVLPTGVDSLVLLRERGLGIVAEPTQAAVNPEATQSAAAASVKPTVATRKASAKPETVGADHVANVEARSAVISSKPAKSKSPVAPEKSAEAACFTLGPFAQANAASRAADAISALGVSVTRRQESRRTPKGYWVYLPAAKSYLAAKRMVAELQKKGLTDLYIMGKGSRENAISLGLFNNKTTAEERFQQVNKLGLKAVFETQYRVSKQAWLDMSVAGNQTATVATLTEMAEGIPNASLTQRKCQ